MASKRDSTDSSSSSRSSDTVSNYSVAPRHDSSDEDNCKIGFGLPRNKLSQRDAHVHGRRVGSRKKPRNFSGERRCSLTFALEFDSGEDDSASVLESDEASMLYSGVDGVVLDEEGGNHVSPRSDP